MSNTELKGKTAIVTGGSGGIGQACAQMLARDGATVLIMGRTEDKLVTARENILKQAPGARVEIFAGDAFKDGDVRAACEHAHAISGRLDILVPTVGGGGYKKLLDMVPADLALVFERNVLSAFTLIHHGLPLMKAGGAIVCISSITATQANVGLSAYGTAKAALERFVRAAAFELGDSEIRINAVRAGATRSAEVIAAATGARLVINKEYAAETPLGRRLGDPVDVARVVRFLAGPESGWVTGETIAADGGLQYGKAPDLSQLWA